MQVPTCYGYVKPCPICGSHAKHGWRRDTHHDHVGWFISESKERPTVLWCYTCHCSMSGTGLPDAIDRWNDRRKYTHRN